MCKRDGSSDNKQLRKACHFVIPEIVQGFDPMRIRVSCGHLRIHSARHSLASLKSPEMNRDHVQARAAARGKRHALAQQGSCRI